MSKRAAEKLDELPDISPDREQKLASQFDDPGIDLIFSSGEAAPVAAEAPSPGPSLVEETAAAVQELMLDAGAPAMPEGLPADANDVLLLESGKGDGTQELIFDPAAEADISAPDLGALEIPAASPGMEIEPGLDVAEEANQLFMLEGASVSENQVEMATRLFDLVNCEKAFQEMMDLALQAVMSGVAGEAGAILEVDHERAEFFFRTSQGGGDPEKLKSFRVPLTKGIVGHVVESREPMLLRSLETDEHQLRAISLSSGLETRTCMAAPILVQNQVYGAIEIFNKQGGAAFDEKDLAVLLSGTAMIAKILEVRFLMAELARRMA